MDISAKVGATNAMIQQQIDNLREQLYELVQTINHRTLSKRYPLNTSELSADERVAMARNEMLRKEKVQLLQTLVQKDTPEIRERKNAIIAVLKQMEQTASEIRSQEIIRQNRKEALDTARRQEKELQDIQQERRREEAHFKQVYRELSEAIHSEDKRSAAQHLKLVKVNERSKCGVTEKEMEQLQQEIKSQDEEIQRLQAELDAKQSSHDAAMRHAVKRMTDAEKEVARQLDKIKKLEEILRQRDVELKRSYNTAKKAVAPKKSLRR
jgi:uncharacterized small protein (DUF1192 family)